MDGMSTLGGNLGRGCAGAAIVLVAGLVPGAHVAQGATSPPLSARSAAPPSTASPAAPLPPVRIVDPAKLKRGPDAAFAHLQDGRIHVRGARLRVRVPHTAGRQILLGRSGADWLVASAKGERLRVDRIRLGQPPRLVPRSRLRGQGVGIRLSREGERLLFTYYDRGGATVTVRRVADGRRVGRDYTGLYHQAFDAADAHVLLHREDAETYEAYAADWVPGGGGDRRLGTGLNAGFLRRDVVFVQDGAESRRFGPTSVSSPAAPAWSARFAALAISPDASLVIGTGPRLVGRRQVLQVRRMSDGTVLQQFGYGRAVPRQEYWSIGDAEQTARFESDTHFVFELVTAGRSRLIRCSTAGRCAKASGPGGGVSVSFEQFMW